MTPDIEVLLVDDEEHVRRAAGQMLDLAGFSVHAVATAEEALTRLSRAYKGIVVSDIRMPGMDGMQLLRQSVNIDADLPVVLVTGHGDVSLAVAAMRDGAYDFIEKPFTADNFLKSVGRAVDKRQLTLENRQLRDSVANRSDDLDTRLAGRGPAMCAIRNQIRAIAATPADVLIVGETGTGKEIVARAIHELTDPKVNRPFSAINCAALPAEMVESELFGYEAGAFPGATRARFGKFEHGRNGTIFLDEAESMSQDMQVKLLRVVQERAVTRLGSNEAVPLNARFIAASAFDPEDADSDEIFRKDLLYRLNVITLHLPPISARREDIPGLFALFVLQSAAKHRLPARTPSDEFISALVARDWPGNVRELRNAADRYVLGIDTIGFDKGTNIDGSLSQRVATFERELIAAALRAKHGRLKPVYEMLGLSRKSLYEKMQKHELDRDSFRADDA